MAERKEVHFFDNDALFSQGAPNYSEYHKWFRPNAGHVILGEATPIYMYWKGAMQRMRAYNPNFKLILLLRNPAERAYSHWNMERSRGAETMPFIDALCAEQERLKSEAPLQHRVYSYVDRGYYCKQLKQIWKLFDRKNVLVMKQEDLDQAPESALKHITEFLGLPDFLDIAPRKVHALAYRANLSTAAAKFLTNAFAQEIDELEQVLGWNCNAWREL